MYVGIKLVMMLNCNRKHYRQDDTKQSRRDTTTTTTKKEFIICLAFAIFSFYFFVFFFCFTFDIVATAKATSRLDRHQIIIIKYAHAYLLCFVDVRLYERDSKAKTKSRKLF